MAIAQFEREDDERLPVYLTRFIGREAELQVLAELIDDPSERAVTLAGPGGVGKTRLLVEAIGASLAALPELVYVDGARLNRADLLLPEIVELLGIDRAGDLPSGELLSEFLSGQRYCWLLDNMEHLLPAAPDLAALLRAAPGLRIIATSRAPLRISGERLVQIEPLATTPAIAATQSVAAELFLECASRTGRLARPTGVECATVEAICARLDGLPLAIELAAARTRVLSLPALQAVLTHQLAVLTGGPVDVSERHRTLRAAISWSYELLDPEEQRLLRELSIFPDAFSLESVGGICTPAERNLLDLLDSLFNQALLLRTEDDDAGQPRFRLLTSIREFGLEQLGHLGEESSAKSRYAAYFLAQAELREPSLLGTGQADSVRWLARENASYRQALDVLIELGDQHSALRMVGALSRFWLIRVQWDEARANFQRVFAMGESEPTIVWGAALRGAGIVAEAQLDWNAAMAFDSRAIAIWEELGERLWTARSRIDLGNLYANAARFDEAREQFQLAAAAIQMDTDRRTRLVALGSVAIVDLRQGRLAQADRGFEAILPELRRIDDPWLLATCLSNHGIVQERLNRLSEARATFEESLAIRRALQDDYGIGVVLINLANVQPDEAGEVAVSLEALEIGLRIGAEEMVAAARVNLGQHEYRNGNLTEAGALYTLALNGYFALGDEIQVADALTVIGELIAAHDPPVAARLLGAVHAIQDAHDISPTGPIAQRATVTETHLRESLHSGLFETELARGRTLSLVEARLDAIEAVRAVENEHPAGNPNPTPNVDRSGGLTARELDVLRLVAAGKSDRQIADELFITVKTASHHVTNILAKLECRNRTAATAVAFRLGLVERV